MSVAVVDTPGSFDESSADTSHTFAYTNSTGTFLIVLTTTKEGSAGTGIDISAVTYNGVALTPFLEFVTPSSDVKIEGWYLQSPATGANNVVITSASSTSNLNAVAISLTGVASSSPIDTGTIQSNTSTNATSSSLNVTSETGDLVMDLIGIEGGSTAATIGASQTSRWSLQDSTGTEAVDSNASTEPGGATITMSWTTISTFRDFYHAAFNINAAPANTGQLLGGGFGKLFEGKL